MILVNCTFFETLALRMARVTMCLVHDFVPDVDPAVKGNCIELN